MHQIDGISTALCAPGAFYLAVIVVVQTKQGLECPDTAPTTIEAMWNIVRVDYLIQQCLKISKIRRDVILP